MAKRNLTESELNQQLVAYQAELSEEKYQKVLREGDHVCGLEALHAWQAENKVAFMTPEESKKKGTELFEPEGVWCNLSRSRCLAEHLLQDA